jgi:hypothetical protein
VKDLDTAILTLFEIVSLERLGLLAPRIFISPYPMGDEQSRVENRAQAGHLQAPAPRAVLQQALPGFS